MFRHHGDDVVLFILVELPDSFQRDVVRFRRAAGKDDLLGISVDKVRDLAAGDLPRLFRFPAIRMAARMRVAEFSVK